MLQNNCKTRWHSSPHIGQWGCRTIGEECWQKRRKQLLHSLKIVILEAVLTGSFDAGSFCRVVRGGQQTGVQAGFHPPGSGNAAYP